MAVIDVTENNDLITQTAALQTSPVADLDTGFLIHDAFATLYREDDGVKLTVETKLPPGAYTIWWIVFNNPESCEDGCGLDDIERPSVNPSVFWATGEVVGDDGIGSFSAQLPENYFPDDPEQIFIGDDGLINSFSAEIHYIIRSHGSAIPGQVEEQITTLNGGCPPEICQDIQFAVFPSVLSTETTFPQVTIGDFIIGFDDTRMTDTASGLFISDALNPLL